MKGATSRSDRDEAAWNKAEFQFYSKTNPEIFEANISLNISGTKIFLQYHQMLRLNVLFL